MKTSPSTSIASNSVQHISYNSLTGTEGTFLFDCNSSIKFKYQNYSRNDTNLSETIFEDRLLEPQPSSTQMRNDMVNQKSVETFDLHEIIQRYGNHPDLLELVLSSKLEEDRRKTEEAKLKQKELEYLILKKEQSCRACDDRKDTSPARELNLSESTLDKGKSKQSTDESHSNLALYIPRLALQNDSIRESIPKRAREEDLSYSQQPVKDVAHISSSSYLSPAQPNLSSEPQRKRHGSLNQIYTLESPTTLVKRKPSSEEPVRQLQSLDYLNSRRTSSNYQQITPYQSYGKNVLTNCSLPTNTLPPISMSFKSNTSNDPTRNLAQVTSQPIVSTNILSNECRNGKYRSLSTLDSFETSIMETLPFDNNSSASSQASLENAGELNAQASGMTLDDGTILHVPPLQKRKPVDANNNNLSSNAVVEESSTKKLLLPPNRPNPQVTSSLSNRPRRRRREMQAITMIIETKEFPYNDDYVWKNNGNTIHKSTGQKSIYYKCSNSIVGCPVNKTVTFRDNGEYLIKYRGNHLEECNKIKRIINI